MSDAGEWAALGIIILVVAVVYGCLTAPMPQLAVCHDSGQVVVTPLVFVAELVAGPGGIIWTAITQVASTLTGLWSGSWQTVIPFLMGVVLGAAAAYGYWWRKWLRARRKALHGERWGNEG